MTRSLAAGFLALAASLASLPASSVRVDPNGFGQALIYPYYTARKTSDGNEWNTLFSVVNTHAKPKAVKVRFREGRHGRVVMELNLYLGPNDVWTGAVFPGSDGAAHLVSTDITCTDPSPTVDFSTFIRIDFGSFSTSAFSGSAADGAGSGMDRTLEGFIEMIEMGTLGGASAAAATDAPGGAPTACPSLIGAGRIRTIEAPEGGLTGTALLINVNSGLAVPYAPVALADLTKDPFYSDVGAAGTDWDSAQVTPLSVITAPAASGFGSSTSGYLLRSSWSRGVDAVSAVLMASRVQNEFVLDHATASDTDWVVALPTARFYVDGASSVAPFDATFGASGACELFDFAYFNREQATVVPGNGGFPEAPPPPPPPTLCWASTVVSYRNGSQYAPTTPVSPSLVFGSTNTLTFTINSTFQDGYVLFDLAPAAPGLASLPTSTAIDLATGDVITGAHLFKGLPVAGFGAWKFDNGLLGCNGQACKGSFGAVYPHHFIQNVTRIAP